MKFFPCMSLPFFYIENVAGNNNPVVLDEDTSRHVVSVLRMKPGGELHLTDGKGLLLTTAITNDHKKRCEVRIIKSQSTDPDPRKISIAVSLIKNATRFEWFLEKATEIGITEIMPLLCERTERQHFRHERMKGLLVSAMLQSQQCWLPVLHEPQKFDQLVSQSADHQKFIAHCLAEEKRNLRDLTGENQSSQIILIGPEGDFTKEEIDLALQHHFIAVALGATRLRTETAAVAAAVILKTGR
jgi:16S rRNA (uracil1498-N3)-methyltransferase